VTPTKVIKIQNLVEVETNKSEIITY